MEKLISFKSTSMVFSSKIFALHSSSFPSMTSIDKPSGVNTYCPFSFFAYSSIMALNSF
jgi:hypothetical protein